MQYYTDSITTADNSLLEVLPLGRAAQTELNQQVECVQQSPFVAQILDLMPEMVLLLNAQRQIVHANKAVRTFLAAEGLAFENGMRPGEALCCRFSNIEPAGCGASVFCRHCGVVQAIVCAQTGDETPQECRMRRKNGESLDLRVCAAYLMIGGERFTMLVLSDISNEKRRQSLERIFFHDLLNIVGSLRGYAEALIKADEDERIEFAETIRRLSDRVIEEIGFQRDLLAAERSDLLVRVSSVHTGNLLAELIRHYKNSDISRGCYLQMKAGSAILSIKSDPNLLSRIIGNMLKNALEASDPGQMITLGAEHTPDEQAVRFTVHNPNAIPKEIQQQIFQRSFSTKGADRGLGTYSMKLLAEHYLGGRVAFTSTPDEGTTFSVEVPLQLEIAEP